MFDIKLMNYDLSCICTLGNKRDAISDRIETYEAAAVDWKYQCERCTYIFFKYATLKLK